MFVARIAFVLSALSLVIAAPVPFGPGEGAISVETTACTPFKRGEDATKRQEESLPLREKARHAVEVTKRPSCPPVDETATSIHLSSDGVRALNVDADISVRAYWSDICLTPAADLHIQAHLQVFDIFQLESDKISQLVVNGLPQICVRSRRTQLVGFSPGLPKINGAGYRASAVRHIKAPRLELARVARPHAVIMFVSRIALALSALALVLAAPTPFGPGEGAIIADTGCTPFKRGDGVAKRQDGC
ncbi:hypothetical protein AURDEDRAFT_163168 [Auricularia subglabra TFB-10046 SS5]|nr:hypothetical protein AURDEDRAFT_163168 [Auricularia subglabra TFB-10046 SS5]